MENEFYRGFAVLYHTSMHAKTLGQYELGNTEGVLTRLNGLMFETSNEGRYTKAVR